MWQNHTGNGKMLPRLTSYALEHHQRRLDNRRWHRDDACRALPYPSPTERGRHVVGLSGGRSPVTIKLLSAELNH